MFGYDFNPLVKFDISLKSQLETSDGVTAERNVTVFSALRRKAIDAASLCLGTVELHEHLYQKKSLHSHMVHVAH